MKVKLLISRCGPNLSQSVGDVVDVGDDEGSRMIEAGQAKPIDKSPQSEAAPEAVPEAEAEVVPEATQEENKKYKKAAQ